MLLTVITTYYFIKEIQECLYFYYVRKTTRLLRNEIKEESNANILSLVCGLDGVMSVCHIDTSLFASHNLESLLEEKPHKILKIRRRGFLLFS